MQEKYCDFIRKYFKRFKCEKIYIDTIILRNHAEVSSKAHECHEPIDVEALH